MISLEVWTILNGKGACRGMPEGMQLAFGSSFDSRSLVSFTAHGCRGSFSPGLRALAISPMNLGSGPQSPVRSGLPSAVRGVGPPALALRRSRLRMGTPPPAGLTPAGSGCPWANAEVAERAKRVARERAVTMEQAKSLLIECLLARLLFQPPSCAHRPG